MDENTFFSHFAISSKIAYSTFGTDGPALSSQFPGREGGIGVKPPPPHERGKSLGGNQP